MTFDEITGVELISSVKPTNEIITCAKWSPKGRLIAIGSFDEKIYLWDTKTNNIGMLGKHKSPVLDLDWSPDGKMIVTGSGDNTACIWEISTGTLKHSLHDHLDSVFSVCWSPVSNRVATGSSDGTVKIWNSESGKLERTLGRFSRDIRALAWSGDGGKIFSGDALGIIRIWDIDTNAVIKEWKAHTEVINGMLFDFECNQLITCSDDKTVIVWCLESYKKNIQLEGHLSAVKSISNISQNKYFVTKSSDSIFIWNKVNWEQLGHHYTDYFYENHGKAFFHHKLPILCVIDNAREVHNYKVYFDVLIERSAENTVHYINAKAVLVGESGVGKSGLGIRLAKDLFFPTESTHGATYWHMSVPKKVLIDKNIKAEATITLWDLAGQPEYHLIHQLFLDDTNVSLLLFDCSDASDPFKGVPYWAKVLKKQSPSECLKYLVSSRSDVSPVTVDQYGINQILSKYELKSHFTTCAKTGLGTNELLDDIHNNLDWNKLPKISTQIQFQIIREYIISQKTRDRALITVKEICNSLAISSVIEVKSVLTVVELLQAQGNIYLLDSETNNNLILLKPEVINQYASSIIHAARTNDIGSVPERDVLKANITLIGFDRLENYEERVVIEATVEILIKHGLCFREMGWLVFPSQICRSRTTKEHTHYPTEVAYQFSGSIEAIYASLVVRLSYTDYFQRTEQWKYSSEFSCNNKKMGFTMKQIEEGTGELEIYFEPSINEFDKVTFIRFITDHLRTKGLDIQEKIKLYCLECKREFVNWDAVEERIKQKKLYIVCQYCDSNTIIPRSIEEKFKNNNKYMDKQDELVEEVEKRTKNELQEFKEDYKNFTLDASNSKKYILHLSDVHISTDDDTELYKMQLELDLKNQLGIKMLHYLVVSGDIGTKSTSGEYKKAFDLVDGIVKRFGLISERVVIVPGNHDLNWDLSDEGYDLIPKRKITESMIKKENLVSAGEVGALKCDYDRHNKRFKHFSDHFYKKIYSGVDYPLDYSNQAIIFENTEDKILFVGLNSSWKVDNHHKKAASVNTNSLSKAIGIINNDIYNDWLKIAVAHHPVTGEESMNDEFMELLAVAGFRIYLHGHLHEAINNKFMYDFKHNIHIIGAGTFGSPAKEQRTGIPLQYNLLIIDTKTKEVTVETRKKEKVEGAWSADARWGDKNNPTPRYDFKY